MKVEDLIVIASIVLATLLMIMVRDNYPNAPYIGMSIGLGCIIGQLGARDFSKKN